MVKVQKPIPKTIKKLGPALEKIQKKNIKGDTAVKVKKILDKVVKNEVTEKTQKKIAPSKKSKVLEKVNENSQNRKEKGPAQGKKFAKQKLKISADLQVTPKSEKSVSKIKKQQKSNSTLEKSSLEELPKTNSKSLIKEKPVVEKVPKAVAEKKSSLEKVSKTIVKVPQQSVKSTLPKKTALEKNLQPVKNVTTATNKSKQKFGKLEQKKQFSKVQTKSVETKKEFKSEIKNKKDKSEVKKADQKDKDENSKSDVSKSISYEPDNFDEDQFKNIVSLQNIKKICKALKSLVEKEVSEKKTAIFSDYVYFLNVAYFKIPNCPKRMVKLNLKHALVNPESDDVVIIVPDLQRGAKVDFEPTIQHYEDILRENGVENIKVMPFNQLRNEYSSYEAKRKLANTYDRFLCDGRIVGHVVGFCGKNFQKPRTTIHAVTLSDPKNFKSEIEHALKRTSYRQLQKGDLISIPVGNHLFTADQLAENIQTVIEQLKTILPGSYANMRNIHLKIDIRGTSSLPLYANLASVPTDVPNIIGPREQKMIKLKKEANDILSKFNLSKTGNIVKLNKTQLKRKQKLQEARATLTAAEDVNVDENVSELDPPLNKKFKKQIESHGDEHEIEDEDSEESFDESEEENEENDDY